MEYKCTNAYYLSNINTIGGIESHFLYLAKKYKNYDIAFICRSGNAKQIERLRKYARVIIIDNNDKIKCKILFCCFVHDILNQVEADKKYFVVHGDYKSMLENKQINVVPDDERFDGYLGVSQLVCDTWFELTKKKTKLVYEPIVLDKVDKPLFLVSATRLSEEKGWERMKILSQLLDDNKVNYLWFVFSDTPKQTPQNMIRLDPRLDIVNKLDGFDAYVQLSDNEGYCLSIVEALIKGLPVIATDLPVLKEIGLNEDNSIILPFDMKDVPIDKIKKIRSKKFKYTPIKDKWDSVLDKTPRVKKSVKVITTDGWIIHNVVDRITGKFYEKGTRLTLDEDRYIELRKFEETHHVSLIEDDN